jgi:2-phosphosulfolactate phosphatase
MGVFDQKGFEARFEWGAQGAREAGRDARVIVVVDVLRFTSTVDAAVTRGAMVYPHRWRDYSAAQFAKKMGAVLAVRREEATPDRPFSLSPISMDSARPGTRIVLPSPNGAEVSIVASEHGTDCLAGCLRNASAVAAAALAIGPPIAVIAAGERWKTTEGLRPCFEDLVGAGAILQALGSLKFSPEASLAAAAFSSSSRDLERLLLECSSGRELIERGFSDDVVWCAKLDVSDTVPRFVDGAFSGA